ncbi:GNAT family N-acetyltransferase [Nocardiopsis dassonvillei]|uniref:GNAT family N-acetyltransferase n=1 Tax=Nocardiopsis dassonvillei TaxID=2014 RepID=UPI0036FA890A
MASTEIRTFREDDRAELRALFARAGEGSPSGTLWGHLPSEAAIYLDPYMDHVPESLLIALVDGRMAGYLTGCPDPSAMPGESELMDRAIREHRLALRRGPAAFFARALLDTAVSALRRRPTAGELSDPRWPAHLHVNVESRARGTGVGAALVREWQERLREQGSRGCHLQTLVENTGAVRFFARAGFEPHGPAPVVPGVRFEGGHVHQRTMVWSPSASRP